MTAEPQCLWTAGVITKEWTALEETYYMKEQDLCQPCIESTRKCKYMDRRQQLELVHMQVGECGPLTTQMLKKWGSQRERPRI
eukprot:14988885-Heterocapsa_arctica.AAC.1